MLLAVQQLNDFSGESIPKERITEMENEVKTQINLDELTKETLEKILEDARRQAEKEKILQPDPGKQVVDYFTENGKTIFDLQWLWRNHFVTTMEPKFLPKHWSVDHRN